MVELAVRFVVRESATFSDALRAGDGATISWALHWHEEAHGPWLALLQACRRAGWRSVTALDRLYAFHGRLAELLAGDPTGRDPEVRAVLDDHLRELTHAAIEGLRIDARTATWCNGATGAQHPSTAQRATG